MNTPSDVQMSNLVQSILSESAIDIDIDFISIIQDNCKESRIDLDDLVDYISENSTIKNNFAVILSHQKYDSGLYKENILEILF